MLDVIPFEQPLPLRRGSGPLDISCNWARWLAREGGEIATYSITVPSGITKHSEVKLGSRTVAYISLSPDLPVGRELECLFSITNTSFPVKSETQSYRIIVT